MWDFVTVWIKFKVNVLRILKLGSDIFCLFLNKLFEFNKVL
jgi:hypothetical protein